MIDMESGVHTYSVAMTLTKNEFYEIDAHLSVLRTEENYWTGGKRCTCHDFCEQGIVLYLSRFKSGGHQLYRLKVRIEPCRVLGSSSPLALYQPNRKSYQQLVKTADRMLKKIKVPRSIDDMKICRQDMTVDLYFQTEEPVKQYVRACQKGMVLPHYKQERFRDAEHKAKYAEEANRGSCRQTCKSASFFVYNKSAQLKMTGRDTDVLKELHILRLEAELKRPALKKRLGEQADNYHYLKEGERRAKKVVEWYLKRIFKNADGEHLRFEDATIMMKQSGWKEKTRKQITYLLRKVSDSQSLNAAIGKTKQKYGLSVGQMERLLIKLRKLDISPITLPNTSKNGRLKSLIRLIKECF